MANICVDERIRHRNLAEFHKTWLDIRLDSASDENPELRLGKFFCRRFSLFVFCLFVLVVCFVYCIDGDGDPGKPFSHFLDSGYEIVESRLEVFLKAPAYQSRNKIGLPT